jgi:hypothetical protein
MQRVVPDRLTNLRTSLLGLLVAGFVLGAASAQAAAKLDGRLDEQLKQAKSADVVRVIVRTTPGSKPAMITKLKGLGGTVL